MSVSSPAPAATPLSITGAAVSPWEVEDVAVRGRAVTLGGPALRQLAASHQRLERAVATGRALYGVNTGFGSLSTQRIMPEELALVQRNLLRSHASGVGDPLPAPCVRAMLLLLVASLARGYSGVRPILAERIVDVLNAGITPVVPEIGSVGASGDLAPLAHASLCLLGEGEVTVDGTRRPAAAALAGAGIEPLELGPKEGLALINGTHLMAGRAALLLPGLRRLVDAAIVAASMSIDAARATDRFLDPRLHEVRRQPGQRRVASRMREHLAGSEIVASHRENDPRVQDPYSFRCAPQILGPALDQIEHAAGVVDAELLAVTDNPLVFETDDPAESVVSGGNFHGMPLALALDAIAMALCHIAGPSERRVYHLLAASDPYSPRPAHLSPHPGVESGYMITQYAAAACCNELITLASPASVANLSTCAGMEDYNAFGPRSAAKAARGLELAERVVAIELLCAAEALQLLRPLRSGPGVERAHAIVRSVVLPLTEDRSPAPDIEAIARLVRAGRFG